MRSDLRQAKSLQELEYQEMLIRHQKALREQMEEDAKIALLIHKEEMKCATANKNGVGSVNTAELDRLLAEKIQAKEKMRVLRRQLAKEKRQVQRLGSGSGLDSESNEAGVHSNSLTDLTEFCMKPPPGLTEEETKIFQAEQDEELARFLQRQEAVRNATKDKLHQIEAQDHEIAKILQDQERARMRRHKERARMKARRESPGPTPSSPERRDVEPRANSQPSHFHNIAIDLDPTYHKNQSPPDELSGVHFARLCRVSPTPSASELSGSPSSTGRLRGDAVHPERSSSPTTAYIPVVPGHKRRKDSSQKKGSDGCRTH